MPESSELWGIIQRNDCYLSPAARHALKDWAQVEINKANPEKPLHYMPTLGEDYGQLQTTFEEPAESRL